MPERQPSPAGARSGLDHNRRTMVVFLEADAWLFRFLERLPNAILTPAGIVDTMVASHHD